MFIRDLFLYFARFVPKAALRDAFTFSGHDGSAALLQECLALPDDAVQAPVTAFIFGPDEDSVRERISAAPGMYLFVDYSAATSYIDSMDVKTDKMHIGITVAVPTPDDIDQPSRMLIQDDTLAVVKAIRDRMRADSDADPSLEWLPMEASTITPFLAKALAGSTGWLLEWNIKLIDTL